MISKWSFPTTIFSGAGAAEKIGEEAERLGGKAALIVSDPSVRRAGLLEKLVRSLEKSGVGATVYDASSVHPLETEVFEALDEYQGSGSDVLIGIGGGGPVDAAKIVRLLAVHAPPLARYEASSEGETGIQGQLPPMIAIPTTAGAASAVSIGASVTLEAENRRAKFSARPLLPDVVLLDPELTRHQPPRQTALEGVGSLARSIEAYCALGNHPMAEAIALQAIELILRNLEEAAQDSENLEAREKLLEAAMMSGVASEKGLGATASLARAVSARFEVDSGLVSAICLPAVIDFNRMVVPAKLARIAKILGVNAHDEEALAFEAPGAIRGLLKRIGLEETLRDLSVPEGELPALAALAIEDEAHSNSPRPATEKDLLFLYRSVF